jgi:nitroimidazol reductase NimA-like FMN-containing flavoprotein (pyridoxamine 5'-phosphate oxidase superfamily)
MDDEANTIVKTDRTTLGRHPERGHWDFDTLAAILDEACICHLGYTLDGQPQVIPTSYGREGQTVYIHGHMHNQMLRLVTAGLPICFTVTILDGLVLAKSAFRHSMNFRSVMAFGVPALVSAEDKRHALEVIVNHITPGRWQGLRPIRQKEIDATLVASLRIDEASAKIRRGPPNDLEEDRDLDLWSGLVPAEMIFAAPVPAPDCGATAPPPVIPTRRGRGG